MANTEPTERSMPPERTATAIAAATIACSEKLRASWRRLPRPAYPGMVSANVRKTAMVSANGMTGSIQRFSSNSPRKTWGEC